MKTGRNSRKYKKQAVKLLALTAGAMLLFTGCGSEKENETEPAALEEAKTEEIPTTGIDYESAIDTRVNFEALKAENPDIFGWLYLPGTNIDYPILQSTEADDYYETHNAWGENDQQGALYTELANLTNMCDFNTVIHGKNTEQETMFGGLYKFADPDYFKEHEKAYVYIDGNLLTYEIFAAFEREDTSLIRTYDFTYAKGCQEFLNEVYGKSMGKNLREGWEGITPYHFLITLSTKKKEASNRQFIVVAALVGDAAGTIDRVVEE